MVKCTDCDREVSEEDAVYCEMCGCPLCGGCAATGLCASCDEMMEDEVDLEDAETEEEA